MEVAFTVKLAEHQRPAGGDRLRRYEMLAEGIEAIMPYFGAIRKLSWDGTVMHGIFIPNSPMGEEFARQLEAGTGFMCEDPTSPTFRLVAMFSAAADLVVGEEVAGRLPRRYANVTVWAKGRCLVVQDEEDPIHICGLRHAEHIKQDEEGRPILHRCHCGITWSVHEMPPPTPKPDPSNGG